MIIINAPVDDYNIVHGKKFCINQGSIILYVNGKFLIKKKFTSRTKRNKWMKDMIEQLGTYREIFFELSYYHY